MRDKLGYWLQRRYWEQVNENQRRIYRGVFWGSHKCTSEEGPLIICHSESPDPGWHVGQPIPLWSFSPVSLPRPWFLEWSETTAMSRGCQGKERPYPHPPMQTCFKAWNKPELCVVGGWEGWQGQGRTEHIFRLGSELRTSMLLN